MWVWLTLSLLNVNNFLSWNFLITLTVIRWRYKSKITLINQKCMHQLSLHFFFQNWALPIKVELNVIFILSSIYECICVANVPHDRCQYSSQYNKICILYGRKKRHPWGMFSFKRPMEYIFCFSYIIQWVLNVSILKSYSRLQHLYILFGCLLFKAPIADIPLI